MPRKKSQKPNEIFPLVIILTGIALSGVAFLVLRGSSTTVHIQDRTITSILLDAPEPPTLKREANYYYDLIQTTNLPNTEQLTSFPFITGHQGADERIVQLAVARGYKLQKNATVAMVTYQGYPVQSAVRDALRAMQDAAREDGIYLSVASGYRSVVTQRDIFLIRLGEVSFEMTGRFYSHEQIASGEADGVLNWLLGNTSIPGTSRHHSGYAIDITDASIGREFTKFGSTAGYIWMSENDFANARKFGFVPSYPLGEGGYGPNPEPWEYVWVGK